jgi:hypothetical protein
MTQEPAEQMPLAEALRLAAELASIFCAGKKCCGKGIGLKKRRQAA